MMRDKPSVLWRWYVPHLSITLLTLAVAAFYSLRVVEKLYTERLVTDLETQAYLAGQWIGASDGALLPASQLHVRSLTLGAATGQRWTFLDAEGLVLSDSEGDLTQMSRDAHALRPEIRAAFRDGSGWDRRRSATVDRNLLYVARRIEDGRAGHEGRTLGVIRVAIPLTQIEQGLQVSRQRLRLFFAVILILALASGAWVSRRTISPVDTIRHGLQQVLRGDLDYRVPSPRSRTVDGMGGDLNSLAQRMQDQIEALAVERTYREAILSSMTEGVMALDADRRIAWVNEAAASLLTVRAVRLVGSLVHEVVPHADFLKVVDSAATAAGTVECEATIHGPRPMVLWIHAAPLRNEGTRAGTVFVFSDLTQIRRLERVRKDFVANVSHELKTPVTAIRGALETLLDGSTHDSDTQTRFLAMAQRQSALLERIVNDLLLLSRIESQAGQALERDPLRLKTVLRGAVDACSRRAAERRVKVELACADDIELQAHASLLEQALINLIDNAIKYGPEDATVHVLAEQQGNAVSIKVRDCGPGIARQHCDRIFERFYRVDRGRSRELGGTGLGLSIVRHIAEVHGGRTTVASTPGQGSTFILSLPTEPQPPESASI